MDKFLTPNEVIERVGLTRMTLDRLEKKGKFPKRFRIGEKKVAWKECDIVEWLNTREASGIHPRNVKKKIVINAN